MHGAGRVNKYFQVHDLPLQGLSGTSINIYLRYVVAVVYVVVVRYTSKFFPRFEVLVKKEQNYKRKIQRKSHTHSSLFNLKDFYFPLNWAYLKYLFCDIEIRLTL